MPHHTPPPDPRPTDPPFLFETLLPPAGPATGCSSRWPAAGWPRSASASRSPTSSTRRRAGRGARVADTAHAPIPSPRRRDRRHKYPPLAVDATGVARLLSLGKRTVVAYDQAGKLSAAVRVGHRKLWVVAELRRWLAAGAPDRAEWEVIKAARTPGPRAAR